MAVDKAKLEAYHKKNLTMIFIQLVIWFLVSLGGIIMVKSLNNITFLGFPLGYYLGAQGSVIVFIIQIFWYAKYMDKIDKEYGFAEE